MKKNYWLIAIFLLLGAGTAWYLLGGKGNPKSTLGWDRSFKVAEQDIQKIFISKRTGEASTLERDGSGWKYNGQWKASENAVHNLLEAVTNIELSFVPPPAAIDGIAKEMAANSIKVEVYGKGNKKLKTYYIGGVTADAGGTYALMDGSEQPMVVKIPLMDGQIRTRYDLVGDDWRDRNVFGGLKPEQIKAVSVEYPQQRNRSFKLSKEGGDWQVKPFYDNVPAIDRPVSQGKVEGFLTGFEKLLAESFENQYPHKDSVRQNVPFSVVTVTDTKGVELRGAFYPTYRLDTESGVRKSDTVERFFTDLSSGDWMLTQYRVFEKIFWPYDAFFESPPKKTKG